MDHPRKLFFALCRRRHRLQTERRIAWADGADAAYDRLSRRCHALTWAILDLELAERGIE